MPWGGFTQFKIMIEIWLFNTRNGSNIAHLLNKMRLKTHSRFLIIYSEFLAIIIQLASQN